MKDQINSRVIFLETSFLLVMSAAFIFIIAKTGPGMVNSCSVLLDNIASSFEQWIAGASFIH